MRSICLILILIAIAQTWAEEPPPPPPRLMLIYIKDSPADTIKCSRLDPTDGVTFLENGKKMRVILTDPTPDWDAKNWEVNFAVIKTTRYYSTNLIDSITFPLVPPPAE